MSQAEPWDNTRVTSMVVTVSYSHALEAWQGTYRVHYRDSQDGVTPLGSAQIGFGPFDTYVEVGYWLAGLSKTLKTMSAVPLELTLQDSPAGNDDGPPSQAGR